MTTITDEHIATLLDALQAITRAEYTCDRCGVEYVAGYDGNCQEPLPSATHDGRRWSQTCSGLVSAAGTARWALAKHQKALASDEPIMPAL